MSSFGGEDSGGYDGKATGTTFGIQGGGVGNEDSDQDMMEENTKVNNDVVDDYANIWG